MKKNSSYHPTPLLRGYAETKAPPRMLSRGTARPVLAGAILAFCPRLVFPPRPRAPSLAAARSLPPAFPTGPLPPNRVGEGSLRRRRAAGSPAPRRSEVGRVVDWWWLRGAINAGGFESCRWVCGWTPAKSGRQEQCCCRNLSCRRRRIMLMATVMMTR